MEFIKSRILELIYIRLVSHFMCACISMYVNAVANIVTLILYLQYSF